MCLILNLSKKKKLLIAVNYSCPLSIYTLKKIKYTVHLLVICGQYMKNARYTQLHEDHILGARHDGNEP